MTNYNERLYEILNNLVFYACEYEAGKDVDLDAETWQAKQAITSLIKELVTEAKPTEKPTDDTNIGSWEEGHQNVGYNRAVIEFEQNLLKALGEE